MYAVAEELFLLIMTMMSLACLLEEAGILVSEVWNNWNEPNGSPSVPRKLQSKLNLLIWQ